MRRHSGQGLVRAVGARAPLPPWGRQALPRWSSDTLEGAAVVDGADAGSPSWAGRTRVPVGRAMVPVGWDLHLLPADGPGRFPEAPGLMAWALPAMPGNAPEGAFPDPAVGWSLVRTESRNLPSSWVVARDRYQSRQAPISRRPSVARLPGPVAPDMSGGGSSLPAGLTGLSVGAGVALSILGVGAAVGIPLAVWMAARRRPAGPAPPAYVPPPAPPAAPGPQPGPAAGGAPAGARPCPAAVRLYEASEGAEPSALAFWRSSAETQARRAAASALRGQARVAETLCAAGRAPSDDERGRWAEAIAAADAGRWADVPGLALKKPAGSVRL